MNLHQSRNICFFLAIINIPIFFLGGGLTSAVTCGIMIASVIILDYLIGQENDKNNRRT